ncbi:hypothetical protein L596_002883 [Steinernema carpocapsae]|uniref:Uncharacterized protein n=1 Tax=Steinernema carpocapsae TaxID=34508 RepID=A0A4U8USE9_STECR|nr:hypothetical protein L596_002883 [Steinernema carpocapsae]
MQSTLCALALCSFAVVLLAGEITELGSDSSAASVDKRGLHTFAFAKRYPMSGFAKRDDPELPAEPSEKELFGDDLEEQKRGWNRFAFAKRSMRNFAFAKRAVRPFAFAKKSMRNFAFAKRGAYSSFA